MRVLNPGWKRWPSFADIYPNFKLVPKIGGPVLVMHVSERGWHVCGVGGADVWRKERCAEREREGGRVEERPPCRSVPPCTSQACLAGWPRLQGLQDEVIDVSHGREVGWCVGWCVLVFLGPCGAAAPVAGAAGSPSDFAACVPVAAALSLPRSVPPWPPCPRCLPTAAQAKPAAR